MRRGLMALVRASAALAARDREGFERELHAVAATVEEGDLEVDAVEEALVQSYLFLGYPAALQALDLWRRISGHPPPPPRGGESAFWRERGIVVCERVYGEKVEALRRNVAGLHPDMARWMVEEGYGKVLGRDGLDLGQREVLISTLLAVQDAPRQLHSHLRGALRNGVTPTEVEQLLEEAERWIPDAEVRARVRETWKIVREGRRSSERGPSLPPASGAGNQGQREGDECSSTR
jgi:4-carboxymuconolactone decarboxylase